ncbi:MAG: tRNA (adenosine(37)-N6)-threonylcarbamoyltransferase complex ATPase subunit type 1 TsaE [Planctomycetota bacterium]|jgi:tRNA threonylcarbamoyladenosine biosynthesis protein TsaE
METFTTNSPEATAELGRQLAQRFGQGDCVALVGQLGAGKTVLVRGLALGLGLADERLVTSPTFVLAQEYPGRVPIFHVDLYRMASAEDEVGDLAIDEMLAEGVAVVEWADRAEAMLPRPHWRIDIEVTGEMERRFGLTRID